MHIHEPKVADEFEKSTPKDKKLPYHVKKESEDMGDGKQVDEKGGFLDKFLGKGGPPPPASPRAGALDVARLKDPQGFVDSVHKFVNGLEQNISTLQHFAGVHSAHAPENQRKTMGALHAELDSLKKTVEPALSRVGRAAMPARTTLPGAAPKDQKTNPFDRKAASDELPRGNLPGGLPFKNVPDKFKGAQAGIEKDAMGGAKTIPDKKTVPGGKKAVGDEAPRYQEPEKKPGAVQGHGGMSQRAGLRKPFGL